MLRRRRGEADDPAAPAAGPAAASATAGHRYRMVEKLVSIGDDFFIENDQGQRVFKVDGKAVRVRDTLIFRDLQGQRPARFRKRSPASGTRWRSRGRTASRMAMVHKAMITPLRERFSVTVGDGPDLEIQGNLLDHEYRIGNVATVSKKWFRVRDSYGVEIAPGQNDLLILAATVCIDQMAH